jgi:hypothetical protein
MPAQRQGVHDQRRRIRHPHERDLFVRNIGERLDRIAAHADMEAVEHDAEIGPVGGSHDVPSSGPVFDMAAPGECLVSQPHALLPGDVRKFS